MRLSDLLPAHGVKVLGAASSKRRLFQELGEMAQAAWGPPWGLQAAEVAEALLHREAMGPTGVGHGVALPHARLAAVSRVQGLFLRLDRPLDFDAVDRQPVDLVFCLLAPAASGVEHLKALALVSRTMRDPATCQKLRANSDPGTLHTILTEGPAHLAA